MILIVRRSQREAPLSAWSCEWTYVRMVKSGSA